MEVLYRIGQILGVDFGDMISMKDITQEDK